MNLFFHSCRLYLRRFRMEIALLWLVSASLSMAAATGADVGVTSRLAPLEIVFLGMVIIRFALAEAAFTTTGGWQVRPLDGRCLFRARLGALVLVIVPLVLFRLLAWAWLVELPAARIFGLLWRDGGPLVLCTAGLLLVVRLARLLLAREPGGIALLVVGPAMVLGMVLWLAGLLKKADGNHDVTGTAGVPQALVGAVPGGTHFLGMADDSNPQRVMRIVTLPLAVGEYEMGERKVKIQRVEPMGGQLALQMEFRTATARDTTRQLIFVVRYSDGSYASGAGSNGQIGDRRFWMFETREETRFSLYESPVSLPWNHHSWGELLRGAKLVVFERGESPPSWRDERRQSVMQSDLANIHSQGKIPRDVAIRLPSMGAERMPAILTWPTWSNAAFQGMVQPYLMRQAEGADVRGMLESRLRTDPRLATVLWSKGWREAVEREISQRLREHRPLGPAELEIATSWRDPSLAESLEEAFIASRGQWPWLRGRLNDYPGIDDRALMLRAWKKARTEDDWSGKKIWLAGWAASEGDVIALRYLATHRRAEWDGRQVLTGSQDPVEWLAENGGNMVFDPERKIFRKP